MNLEQLVEIISNLKVHEIVNLVQMIEQKFNITYDQTLLNNKQIDNSQKEEEKQSLFCVFLNKIGSNKLSIIKLVRAKMTDLGLKQAKDLVESCPVKLLDNLNKDEADLFKTQLENAGAEVLIK